MIVDVYASQANYWRHLAPVVAELRRRGHEVRGWAHRHNRPWGPRATRWDGDVLLVASWLDGTQEGARAHGGVVYLEHGAGQAYKGVAHGYAGAERLEHVRLFLAPSEHVAARWAAAYPQAEARAVGCPALDRHLVAARAVTEQPHDAAHDHDDEGDTEQRDVDRGGEHEPSVDASGSPLVAVAQHWKCAIAPETMPAVPRFAAQIAAIPESGIRLLAHCHPRAARHAEALWTRAGVAWEPDVDAVLNALRVARNALLVADNTSVMYEAAALGVPVLALNAPTYRRDVEHGLRFWSHVPGLQCDEPTEFRAALERAIADPPEAQELRARAAAYAYCAADGRAASRAADAIEEQAWTSMTS